MLTVSFEEDFSEKFGISFSFSGFSTLNQASVRFWLSKSKEIKLLEGADEEVVWVLPKLFSGVVDLFLRIKIPKIAKDTTEIITNNFFIAYCITLAL